MYTIYHYRHKSWPVGNNNKILYIHVNVPRIDDVQTLDSHREPVVGVQFNVAAELKPSVPFAWSQQSYNTRIEIIHKT